MNKILKVVLIIVVILLVSFILRDYVLIAVIKIFYEQNDPGEKLPLPPITTAQQNELSEHIQKNYQTHEQYIVSKFSDHDIVFIGEYHRIKHDAELIQNLIPLLHRKGIYRIGMEFATYKDQYLIDSLVTATEYSQAIANRILFNWSEL